MARLGRSATPTLKPATRLSARLETSRADKRGRTRMAFHKRVSGLSGPHLSATRQSTRTGVMETERICFPPRNQSTVIFF